VVDGTAEEEEIEGEETEVGELGPEEKEVYPGDP